MSKKQKTELKNKQAMSDCQQQPGSFHVAQWRALGAGCRHSSGLSSQSYVVYFATIFKNDQPI